MNVVEDALNAGGPESYPHRMVFVVAESLVAVGGLAGAVQLVTGTFVPPVSDIERLGLKSWRLPGVWLLASGLLAVELLVQIPLVGPSALQAVFGSTSAGLAGLAVHARRLGWRR